MDLDRLLTIDTELADATRKLQDIVTENTRFGNSIPKLQGDEKQSALDSLTKLKDQEAQLKEAEAAVTTAEKSLKDAESALALWTPDTLTAGDVDGLTYDSDSHMANADYAKLESWLSERGLSVPSDPHERQDILTAYLNDHQTEGTAFNDAVAAAQDELDEAKQLEKDLETTASAAKTAAKEAESDQDSAKKELVNSEDKQEEILAGAAVETGAGTTAGERSEEHTSELQSHSFISYAVFCLKKKKQKKN